ncbi:MAG: bifunctional 3-deoxy-7-phosphoheptulonate synthase/chorismate mutase [Gammaproteobacteria bacterium]
MSNVETTTGGSVTHPLTARSARSAGTRVPVGALEFGGRDFVLIAGPCAVESEAQLARAARMAVRAGAGMLRGGAFKPRTSPYAFQGLGEAALAMLRRQGDTFGLPVVTEVMAVEDIPLVSRHADMLQVGARNMQNYPLLRALGKTQMPVLLKRGLSATIDEWLSAAEYILHAGNSRVVLCERGIRTFETATRNTLDLNAVALVKRLTHLPVIVDPSHGTGRRELVVPLSAAAIAAGADGLIIEVHPEPDKALSDGAQSLDEAALAELTRMLCTLVPAVGRRLSALENVATDGLMEAGRRRIDSLDDLLLALLSERIDIARKLGRDKRTRGLPLRDPEREREVLERIGRRCSGALEGRSAARIFRRIMDETLRAERPAA